MKNRFYEKYSEDRINGGTQERWSKIKPRKRTSMKDRFLEKISVKIAWMGVHRNDNSKQKFLRK